MITIVLSLLLPLGSIAQEQVPPVDLSKIKVSDFADDELDLPYYLANFHRVANAVPLEGPQRGWITVSVWRGNSNQRTYNARVLESQLSLAYFYCTKRKWNPYYGSPAVRARLEAMLERWCDMQSPEGKFSEYAEGRWGLAPTAFATKFTGETLRLLDKGPPIDRQLHERVKQTQRKAIIATLTDSALWEHGKEYANQFSNVFAGGLAWLAVHPRDEEVRSLLMQRMKESLTDLQSAAGYFYEHGGPDWGYSLSTHQSNLHIAWHFARGTDFEPMVKEMVQRFTEWLSWNAVIEPDRSGYVLNRAIETRQGKGWLPVSEPLGARNFSSVPAAAEIPLARAFLPTRKEMDYENAVARAKLAAEWPNVPDFEPGNFRAFTPYAVLHRSMVHWWPTARQQVDAQMDLPYLSTGNYGRLSADHRYNIHFLFVRRLNYYVTFNAGEQVSDKQNFGLGLLWARGFGALAQSQSESDNPLWSTRSESASAPYETAGLDATIHVGGQVIKPTPGSRDFGSEPVTVSYPLGDAGRKRIEFDIDRIRIQVEHPGAFVETIPLLKRITDQVRVDGNRVLLERDGQNSLTLEFDPSAAPEIMNERASAGPYRVVSVRVKSQDKLSYFALIRPYSDP